MLVRDVMRPLSECLISPAALIGEAYLPMLYHEQAALVLDERPMRRIIRLRRVLEHFAAGALQQKDPDPLRVVATLAEEAVRISLDAPALQAARLLWPRPSRAVLVTGAGGAVVGLVGWADLSPVFGDLIGRPADSGVGLPLESGSR